MIRTPSFDYVYVAIVFHRASEIGAAPSLVPKLTDFFDSVSSPRRDVAAHGTVKVFWYLVPAIWTVHKVILSSPSRAGVCAVLFSRSKRPANVGFAARSRK
jgi:hypothetical protein